MIARAVGHHSSILRYAVLFSLRIRKAAHQYSVSTRRLYSSLGRLISAYNPESGGVSYTYFDHGGLYTRTDARSVTTTHSYDGLHRLRTKSYTDGTPGVTNEYYLAGYAPQVGRLKSVASSVASTVYTYDALGRVTASTQTVTGSPHGYGFLYTWLLNDGLATMRYPSGRTVTYAQDGAKLYAQGIGYTAHGAITQMQLGNGLVEQWLYNSRLQPTSVRLGDVAGSDSAFGAALDYGATNNNGNLLSQRITGMGLDRTQTYQYDGVNRLIGSGELAVWSRNFAYDQQGNGWVSSASGLSTSSFTPVTSNWFNAQNRLTGMGATYDGAGNQTAIGGFAFSYDAENRLKTSTINGYTTTYSYDGEGRRVKKLLASGEQTLFIYDAMGQLAAEYTTGQFAHSGTRYLTVDHLGSIRAVTSQEKTVLARRDYLPFGEEIPPPLGGRTSVWAADAGLLQKFTGKEWDSETGLYYFGARYFSGAQGRFTTPDEPLVDQDESDPQSWNLYSYVRNNPLNFTDPTGRKCVQTNNGWADDGTGGGCDKAGVNAEGNIIAQKVQVKGKQGNVVAALGLNAFFALDAAANAWFSPIFGRTSYMQDIPTSNNWTGYAAQAGVFFMPGPGGKSSATGKVGIWSETKALSRVQNAYSHWTRHRSEFPNLQNAKQYVQAAWDFVTNPPAGVLTKARANGDILLYDAATNTFAVKNAQGVPRTMFKPKDGAAYFHTQK